MEPNPENKIEKYQTERSNLEICPNCLEPNPDDLAVCSYCGMPLHPVNEDKDAVMTEDEQTLAAARAEAVPTEKKPEKKKEQNGFRRVMPWIGLYLIYYAITGCFDMQRQIKAAQEAGQEVNTALAYFSQLIWFAAGLLMAWPLVKKGWRKLRHLPDEEEEEQAKPQQPNNSSAEQAEEDPVSEAEETVSPEDETDFEDAEVPSDEEESSGPDPVMTDEADEEQETEEPDVEPSE